MNNPDFDQDKKAQRRPIGLMPQWRHDELRLNAIEAAIARYTEAGFNVPPEWEREKQSLIGAAESDDLRTKLAAEKDQHHFVHRLLEKAREEIAQLKAENEDCRQDVDAADRCARQAEADRKAIEAAAATYRRELQAVLESSPLRARRAIVEDLLASENAGQVLLDRLAAAESDLRLIKQHYDHLKRSITATCDIHANFSPGCGDCRLAELVAERDAARADAAKYRDQLERFEKVDPIDWPQSSTSEEHLRQLAEARKEQIQQMRACCRAILASPNPGAPLLEELERLRAEVKQ